MNNHLKYILVVATYAFFLCMPAYSQTIKELETKKKKTLEELAITNKLLNETQKNKKGTENKINLLQRSIRQSSEYISTLNSELALLNHNIDSLSIEQTSCQQTLDALRLSYADNCRILYSLNKQISPILFILSSKNFNQAYRRYQYVHRVSEELRHQAEQIAKIRTQLNEQQNMLTENKVQKETLVSAKELEQQRLELQKQQKTSELSSLKNKEKSLKVQQKKQQQQADKLNQRIQDMIAAEIRRQEEAQKKKNNGGTTPSKQKDPYVMSKEEQLVAGNFEANKGKLPRPIEKGFISGHFGVQPHPVLDKVTINNKGIYLQTPAGSAARAVFDGEVTQIFSVPGSNTSIIIKHGNYRTVYSNLSAVSVKVGDKVKARQNIGKIYTDPEADNKTELYFMLYKNTEIQNPETWLAK